MAPPRVGVAVFALVVAVALLPSPADAGAGAMDAMAAAKARRQMVSASTCDGGIVGGNCDMDVDDLAGAGGELRRSMAAAAARLYISRAALTADMVPCNKKGRSYYHNCANQTAAASDPYRRGCSGITRCHNATIN
uniref:Rapid alkalinization factor 1 n=1 Tax=Leersia perrieri TaxID=77586 RepID=A0A0D9UY04_9ORYZ